MPVFIRSPGSAFVGVSAFGPLVQLQKEDAAAGAKGLRGCHRSVIVGPAMNLAVQLFDELSLRGMLIFLDHFP